MCIGCIQRERRAFERKKQNVGIRAFRELVNLYELFSFTVKKPPENRPLLANTPTPLSATAQVEQEQRKIVQFHCSPIIDFSAGEAIISMRITWYLLFLFLFLFIIICCHGLLYSAT
jgi:hypothetical protein